MNQTIEERRAYHRKYYHLNKDKKSYYVGRGKREWKKIKNNPELHKKSRLLYKKWANTASGIYTTLKNRGRKDFDLSKNDFVKWYEKQEKKCTYCMFTLDEIRLLPYPYNRKNGLTKLSIDRKDNNVGYTIENITLSCFTCNTIKNNFLSYEEMKKIGKTIINPKIKKLLELIK